ncbi:MAG: hypothetical protein OXC42_08515, partial [Gammaproteobacteria bacterium]|nr:hypothetical protein [Gammaproteobacteria bacterium]
MFEHLYLGARPAAALNRVGKGHHDACTAIRAIEAHIQTILHVAVQERFVIGGGNLLFLCGDQIVDRDDVAVRQLAQAWQGAVGEER